LQIIGNNLKVSKFIVNSDWRLLFRRLLCRHFLWTATLLSCVTLLFICPLAEIFCRIN